MLSHLPVKLFDVSYSTVVEDRDGNLLSAVIADDGQWRFPSDNIIPSKFESCIIQFEDSRFKWHPGVDIFALARAFYQNIKSGKNVSGGSTISMQVIILSRKNKRRTIKEKIIEMFIAGRLEIKYSKKEILKMYCSHAPFGGNVVGLESASWRYYGVEPNMLTWGQAATLAVLPNAPSLIYPGKNEIILLNKRNRLIDKLHSKKIINKSIMEMAKEEPLPKAPKPLPQNGIHLLNRIINDGIKGKRIKTTIDKTTQIFIQDIVNKHANILSGNKVYNAACIIIEVETGDCLAYVGNTTISHYDGNQVDIINSLRSPGSTLKPFLYCAMLEDGEILPEMLIPDIPAFMDGFNPKNYNRTYEGAVKASNALSRSLNVPAVFMLKNYGIEKFHHFMKKIGITTFTKPPSHYGLSIILGGGEVTLYQLSGAYASLARTLNTYNAKNSHNNKDIREPNYIYQLENKPHIVSVSNSEIVDVYAIWRTFKAMIEVNRPDNEMFWHRFSSALPVAWKTGTSYGERDAWAIGITPRYVVGVWAGNASGEGRPGLTGINSAAPLLFEIFDYLPKSSWFAEPLDEMAEVDVCSHSGYKVSEYCETAKKTRVPKKGIRTTICPYHKLIHLDKEMKWQVNANCEEIKNIISKKWFVLPPVMEYYYKSKNLFYKPLPRYRDDCKDEQQNISYALIYPTANSRIFLTGDMTGEQSKVVFRAVHQRNNAIIYWHLGGNYIGMTQGKHYISLKPQQGKYTLVLVDDKGESLECSFEIIN